MKTRQILDVHIEQSRPHLVNCANHVRARTLTMADIDTASQPRIHVLHNLQHIQRRWPNLVLRAMIVNGKSDVVLLDELFDARQNLRRRVARNDHRNPGTLGIFKLASNVLVFIFLKVDGPRGVQFDARSRIVRQRLRFPGSIHRQMIFRVLGIQLAQIELLHKANQLGPVKIPKRIAGQSQVNRRWLDGSYHRFRECCPWSGYRTRCCDERTRLNEIASR